jgi:hypothetical protein
MPESHVSQRVLWQVDRDNRTTNQIGNDSDGVSTEIGREIGYIPFDEVNYQYKMNHHADNARGATPEHVVKILKASREALNPKNSNP